MAKSTALTHLIDRAALPYRKLGRFAWYHARGKLAGDPVFAALLRDGLIPPNARLLDLGCGQGLLGAWLIAASAQHAAGAWPPDWPAPSRLASITGVELNVPDAELARRALGSGATIIQGDIREAKFDDADVIVLLDVLHYIGFAAQDEVLAKVRAALPAHGRLLLRVGDASGGWRSRLSMLVDLMVMRMRGYTARSVHCRTLAAWTALLRRLGFAVDAKPICEGTPFANVLLICTPCAEPAGPEQPRD